MNTFRNVQCIGGHHEYITEYNGYCGEISYVRTSGNVQHIEAFNIKKFVFRNESITN